MIYFSRKSDNFQDFIKFWGFVGTKKFDKICNFSIKWTERESVWPEKSVIFHQKLISLKSIEFYWKFDIFQYFSYFV